MLRIGRYGIAFSFGRVFWLQTKAPTRVRHFLWFWFIKEARPHDVNGKQQFSIGTGMEYEGRKYRYRRADEDEVAGHLVQDTKGGPSALDKEVEND